MVETQKLFEDVDKIGTVDELLALNGYVVDRINSLRKQRDYKLKLQFSKGQKVKMRPEECPGKSTHLLGKVGTILQLRSTKAKVQFEGDEYRTWTIPYRMLIPAK